MGKLISSIVPSGIGKTTLVNTLAKAQHVSTAYEQHIERPFQLLFKNDLRYALANQLDYFLPRAEQEIESRTSPKIGLIDGGLDLDFYSFTLLFLYRHMISDAEFDLCRRLYRFIREMLPHPELIVSLQADSETVANRLSGRRCINIARAENTIVFNSLISKWIESLAST